VRPIRLALLLGVLATACHRRKPMPALPVEPQQPPPESLRVALPQPPGGVAPAPVPATTYRFLATAASEDQVALVAFKPCQPAEVPPACGVRVERAYQVGPRPIEIDGPHGVVAAPDGKSFYVTIAHGRPAGWLEKYDVATGALLGRVALGLFPATVDVSPSGAQLYAINFNFDDPSMRPSSLSIVDGERLTELARRDVPHAAGVPPRPTGRAALFRVHDERFVGGGGCAQLRRAATVQPRAGAGRTAGISGSDRDVQRLLTHLGPAIGGRGAGVRRVRQIGRDCRG
jgi:hypothetical protein